MRIRQLGSTLGSNDHRQHLTTFLINEAIAIDAGSLGLLEPIAEQLRVKHVFLSHSHLDHIATLPIFLDNIFRPDCDGPAVYASREVWYSLTRDVLNDRLWPDLSRISNKAACFYSARELRHEVSVQVDGLTVTPVAVDHLVPTQGFLVEDHQSSIVIASDTGPTNRIWELANQPSFRGKLRAVFLECSFPDSHEWLANSSKHLCSRMFGEEVAKVSEGASFITVAVHLKSAMYECTASELQGLRLSNLQIGGGDQVWEF